MANPKYEKWLEENNLILLRGWARDGLTDEQIAKNMSISRSTLSTWKKTQLDIQDALKKGKEIADYEVENALYKKALNGDTTAMIFWLKNRRPSMWRDSRERTDRQDALLQAQINKANAEAKILENKAKKLTDDESVDELLNALVNPIAIESEVELDD